MIARTQSVNFSSNSITILKLKQEIREELKLSEFSLGTPIISNIKTQRDNAINKYSKLVEKIKMKYPEM